MATDKTVANTILQQLGGNRFITMTGAKHFICDNHMLAFQLPNRFAKDGINGVRITLTPMDLYKMEFIKVGKCKLTTVKEYDGVYDDMLQDLFTKTTGLDTHL